MCYLVNRIRQIQTNMTKVIEKYLNQLVKILILADPYTNPLAEEFEEITEKDEKVSILSKNIELIEETKSKEIISSEKSSSSASVDLIPNPKLKLSQIAKKNNYFKIINKTTEIYKKKPKKNVLSLFQQIKKMTNSNKNWKNKFKQKSNLKKLNFNNTEQNKKFKLRKNFDLKLKILKNKSPIKKNLSQMRYSNLVKKSKSKKSQNKESSINFKLIECISPLKQIKSPPTDNNSISQQDINYKTEKVKQNKDPENNKNVFYLSSENSKESFSNIKSNRKRSVPNLKKSLSPKIKTKSLFKNKFVQINNFISSSVIQSKCNSLHSSSFSKKNNWKDSLILSINSTTQEPKIKYSHKKHKAKNLSLNWQNVPFELPSMKNLPAAINQEHQLNNNQHACNTLDNFNTNSLHNDFINFDSMASK